MTYLEKSRKYFFKIVQNYNLEKENILVLANPLSAEEAIGKPGRRDYPIIEGKERILEAKFIDAKGHAFTDSAKEFSGNLQQILELSLDSNQNRAIYTAALNAVLNYLKIAKGTVHCKNDKPEKCAKDISKNLFEKYGKIKVGLIGLNPAIADELIDTFGEKNVMITDLNKDNLNKKRIKILDGHKFNQYLIESVDVVVMTGTIIVNDSFECLLKKIISLKKDYYVFGVTAAGMCNIFNFNRLCPYGTIE
ncbi:MAG: hypothetical protein HN952_05200 [Candidatus Cloacimonetes bacterium]|nr:hypothetical protein [Candidatus Cloacimonadota bacterium]MBT6994337.1 hypothetical protein [Candidatus Cloacimonadota bacterium]MBT7469291.1 hypothetical protein [Candidatus Cloacimonadota bacterium]